MAKTMIGMRQKGSSQIVTVDASKLVFFHYLVQEEITQN